MVESVSSRLCVCVVLVSGGPRGLGSIRAWAVFENKRQSQRVCRCGTEAVGSRSPLFLSIQGHCWGLKINCGVRPVCEAQWAHGPWKTCRASPQEMYKLTRWVYLVYFNICGFKLDNLLWLSKVVVCDRFVWECLAVHSYLFQNNDPPPQHLLYL